MVLERATRKEKRPKQQRNWRALFLTSASVQTTHPSSAAPQERAPTSHHPHTTTTPPAPAYERDPRTERTDNRTGEQAPGHAAEGVAEAVQKAEHEAAETAGAGAAETAGAGAPQQRKGGAAATAAAVVVITRAEDRRKSGTHTGRRRTARVEGEKTGGGDAREEKSSRTAGHRVQSKPDFTSRVTRHSRRDLRLQRLRAG